MMRPVVLSTSNEMTTVAGNTICGGVSHFQICTAHSKIMVSLKMKYPWCRKTKNGQYWYVGKDIGGSVRLKAKADSSSDPFPPLKGWQYWDSATKWNDDPKMESGKPSLPCMTVNVELSGKWILLEIVWCHFVSGEAKKSHGRRSHGRYVVVEGMWKRGRQVRNPHWGCFPVEMNLLAFWLFANKIFTNKKISKQTAFFLKFRLPSTSEHVPGCYKLRDHRSPLAQGHRSQKRGMLGIYPRQFFGFSAKFRDF